MSSPATILFVASLVAAPVSLIVSAAVGWLGYARRGVRLTLAAFGVVLLNGVLFALSLGAIEIFCGGEFACSA